MQRAKPILLAACLSLIACQRADWRPQAIAQAEAKMRDQVADPAAQSSHVQLTGDDKTGQTCGTMTAVLGPDRVSRSERFIVYIDNTAGPYIEGGFGNPPLSQANFDRAWQGDCLNEGYIS